MSEDVDVTELNSDIAEMATYAQAVTEKNGELRNMIKQKIEDRGYEKTALGILRRLAKVSDDKFADCMRTLGPGLQELVGAREGQPEMDFPE